MSTRRPVAASEVDEEVVPHPAALIESLRSFGYTPATAIADLIDNSITAGATHIVIEFVWAGPESSVSIHDDGAGMTESRLRDAMRAGSSNPLEQREPNDLGRFGLGLKTASFSQARSLTVMSKTPGGIATRRWDLDYVGQTNRWSLLKTPSDSARETEGRLRKVNSGTIVIWAKLDRMIDDRPVSDDRARKTFYSIVASVRRHLEMVFHRIMKEDGVSITVNGQPSISWDPFLRSHPKTERLPNEDRELTVPGGSRQVLRIQPYVLPHRSALTPDQARTAAGPRGWNLQQGFYLYRARRLIVAGDWFNPGIKPEEHHKLARIEVEITQDMDPMWNLDVRKSRARPPANLRDDFLRIARATRERAEAVYRYRGRKSVGQVARKKIKPVWFVETDGKVVEYSINRQHDLIQHVLSALNGDKKRGVRGILTLIEKNVPVAHILSTGFQNEEKLPFDSQELTDEIKALIRELFCELIERGLSSEEAKKQLLANQPFERFSAVIEAAAEEGCQ